MQAELGLAVGGCGLRASPAAGRGESDLSGAPGVPGLAGLPEFASRGPRLCVRFSQIFLSISAIDAREWRRS